MKKFIALLFSVLFWAFLGHIAGANPLAFAAGGVCIELIAIDYIPKGYAYQLIGSIAASASGSISLKYVPQFIYMEPATVPTSFTVDVLGDGVVKKLDGNGLNIEKNLRSYGVATNGYLIQLSDGLINDKNVTITITNAVAAPLSIYGFSRAKKGGVYLQSVQNKVFANSGQDFTDFAYLGLPSMATSDDLNITYRDGLTQLMSSVELPATTGMYQNQTRKAIDNINRIVKRASFIPAADQTVYVMRYVRATGGLPVRV
jgi:hypothetical protein